MSTKKIVLNLNSEFKKKLDNFERVLVALNSEINSKPTACKLLIFAGLEYFSIETQSENISDEDNGNKQENGSNDDNLRLIFQTISGLGGAAIGKKFGLLGSIFGGLLGIAISTSIMDRNSNTNTSSSTVFLYLSENLCESISLYRSGANFIANTTLSFNDAVLDIIFAGMKYQRERILKESIDNKNVNDDLKNILDLNFEKAENKTISMRVENIKKHQPKNRPNSPLITL